MANVLSKFYAVLRPIFPAARPAPQTTILSLPGDIAVSIVDILIAGCDASALTALSYTCRQFRDAVHSTLMSPQNISWTNRDHTIRTLLCACQLNRPVSMFVFPVIGTITHVSHWCPEILISAQTPEFVGTLQAVRQIFQNEAQPGSPPIVENTDSQNPSNITLYVSPACSIADCMVGDIVYITGSLRKEHQARPTDPRSLYYYVETVHILEYSA